MRTFFLFFYHISVHQLSGVSSKVAKQILFDSLFLFVHIIPYDFCVQEKKSGNENEAVTAAAKQQRQQAGRYW